MLFFRKKPQIDPDDFIHERWVSRFHSRAERRFTSESEGDYSSGYHRSGFTLKLERTNLFAWAENPFYQYRDFNLDADCSFGEANGYSAMGFCFRQLNDINYYYFLISNRGYYRFDVVFNGNPRILIPWTKVGGEEDKGRFLRDVHLRIVARENRFIFLVDEEWVGEFEDDSISSGRFAWAGQNYDENPDASFTLHRLAVDSRPFEVEAAYSRWSEYVPVDPSLRFRLAESQFLLGASSSALVQLKKIRRIRQLNREETLLAARAFLESGLYEEALVSAERTMEGRDPDSEILRIKGSAFYALNRLLPLKKLLDENKEILNKENWYWGLAGNCEYGLGNWEESVGFYRRASELFPEEPLFRENLSRAVEKMGARGREENEQDLLSSREDAARLYFRREDYNQVRSLTALIKEQDPENLTARILEGKILFHEEEWEKAMEIFAPIAEAGESDDSSVYFLYGLLLGLHDLREQAGRYLEKAAEMEPQSFIYQFKAAEARHLRGDDMGPFLSRSIDLEPDDIWINNLAGLDALERGKAGEALEYLKKAWELYSENLSSWQDSGPEAGDELLINYSQALYNSGRLEEALTILKGHKTPGIHNHLGNLLVDLGDFPAAVEAYEKAVAAEKENRIYTLNCASACIEADFVHRAEELLQLLDEGEDPEVINLLGNLARIRGEFTRAEAAYTEALRLDPENRAIILNLAELVFQKGDAEGALELLDRIPEEENSRRGRRLLSAVRKNLGSP